jgi:hypothetical protein
MLIHLMIVATTQHALAEDDCEAHWPVVEHEGAYYIEGVGCVVGDIGLYCNETFGGDCITWDQAVAIYEESTAAVKSTYLLDCAEGSDHAYRLNQSTSEWEAYLYFDASGSASAQHHLTYGNPSCCDGFETLSFYYGDPYATCIEPTDTGDADTSKTGPCGGGGGAAVFLMAFTLGSTRRRRQP